MNWIDDQRRQEDKNHPTINTKTSEWGGIERKLIAKVQLNKE